MEAPLNLRGPREIEVSLERVGKQVLRCRMQHHHAAFPQICRIKTKTISSWMSITACLSLSGSHMTGVTSSSSITHSQSPNVFSGRDYFKNDTRMKHAHCRSSDAKMKRSHNFNWRNVARLKFYFASFTE